MKIPFFNYPELYLSEREEFLSVLDKTLSNGSFIMQDELFKFETELAKYLNVKHAIGVADGTMALLISLVAAKIGNDDEVLVPSHTFVASAAAIKHSGAKPVLVDCGIDHLIDSSKLEVKITSKTRAIMPVQLNGRVAQMDSIVNIAKKYNLLIIEDSCQALGAKFDDKFAGTFGLTGTFSFFPAKTLGCFGDGGAIITDDDKIASKVKMLRDHGRDEKDGKVKLFGYNSRLDNIQAAILLRRLKNYTSYVKRRRSLALIYQERLMGLDTLLLPPGPNEDPRHFDIFQNYEIEADDREALRLHLEKEGIGTILQWGGFMLHQFKELNLNSGLNHSEEISKKFMLLPMHHLLKKDEVNFICDKILSFYR